MKKNLVKLLAIAAMITSLGACGGNKGSSEESKVNPVSSISVSEEPSSEQPSEDESTESPEPEEAVVITPSELYTLDVDLDTLETTAVYDNVLVQIEDLHLMAYAGQTAWFYYDLDAIGEDDTYYPFQMFGVEAEMIDESYDPEVDYFDYWFTIEGRVKYEDGRIHLVDTIYAERELDEGMEGFYAGIPSSWFDRAHWKTASTSSMHGTLTSGTIQLCSVPELKFEEDETFYAVFPGEDYDLSNEDNYSPFPVVIPADLKAESQAKLKEVFSELEVGDGLYLYAVVIETEFGLGLSFMDGWAGTKTKAGEISIISTWDEAVSAVAGEYYWVPNLEVDNYAISYSAEGSYIYEDLTELYSDGAAWTGIAADQLSNFGLSIFNISLKTGKGEDAQALLQDRLDEEGWVVIDSEDNFFSYNIKFDGVVFGALNLEFSESGIYVEYIGPYATLKYADIASFIATQIAGDDGAEDILILDYLDSNGVAIVYVEELLEYVSSITNIQSAFNWLYANCIPDGFEPTSLSVNYDEDADEYSITFASDNEFTAIDLYFGYNYVEVPVEEGPQERIGEGSTQLVPAGVWVEFDISYYNPAPLTPYDACYGIASVFSEATGTDDPDDSNWEDLGYIFCQAAYDISKFENVKSFPEAILAMTGYECVLTLDWTIADDGETLICVIDIPELEVRTHWQLWNYKDVYAVLDLYVMPLPLE